MGHKWKKDSDGAESCEREACAVRKFGKKWQEKKGRRWNPSHMPLPPCVGKEAAEVKEGLPPLTPEQIEQRAEYARKVLEKRKAPSPSPLEVVRSQLADALNWLRTVDETETGQRLAFDGLRALATLEESIRKDEREKYERVHPGVREMLEDERHAGHRFNWKVACLTCQGK